MPPGNPGNRSSASVRGRTRPLDVHTYSSCAASCGVLCASRIEVSRLKKPALLELILARLHERDQSVVREILVELSSFLRAARSRRPPVEVSLDFGAQMALGLVALNELVFLRLQTGSKRDGRSYKRQQAKTSSSTGNGSHWLIMRGGNSPNDWQRLQQALATPVPNTLR